MSKTLLILTLLHIATAEDPAQVEKKIKIRACIELARLKIEQDEHIIDEVIEFSRFEVNETVDKIVSDILLNCYHSIGYEDAKQALEKGDNLELTPYQKNLLIFDKEQFKSESLEFTPDQVETYKEIILQMNEMASKSENNHKKTIFEIEILYTIALAVGFCAFFYYAIKSIIGHRTKTKELKKN